MHRIPGGHTSGAGPVNITSSPVSGHGVRQLDARLGRRQVLAASAAALLAGCGRNTPAPNAPGIIPATPAAPSPNDHKPTARPGPEGTSPDDAARSTPAPASAILNRPQVPVLCYHQVRDWQYSDDASARTIITPPVRFAEQLAALAGAGYATVTPDQLVSSLEYGTGLPPRPVMLSFDDGSQSQYANALPVLRRHRFVATFFVMTVVLDKPTWLSRAQVRELQSYGMTIGAHTYDHPPVTEYAGTDWQEQLVRPAQELTDLTGRPVRYFAFPYGVWNQAALPHLHAAGYHAAFQLADAQDAREPLLTIRRIIASPEWNGTALVNATRDSFRSPPGNRHRDGL